MTPNAANMKRWIEALETFEYEHVSPYAVAWEIGSHDIPQDAMDIACEVFRDSGGLNDPESEVLRAYCAANEIELEERG